MASSLLCSSLTFIGGGQMAEALIQGILAAGLLPADRILVVDPAPERRQLLAERFGVRVFTEAAGAPAASPVCILAVKPQVMGPVLTGLARSLSSDRLVISIAAGVSIRFIEEGLAPLSPRVIRVMPNTPALVGAGAAALAGSASAGEADLDLALSLFQAVGEAVIVSEKDLDAVTGLSGSGPAYVFSFVEALVDAGVAAGLARPTAERLAVQTVLGSARLLQERGEHPAVLRAMVTSPGGTTIAGLHVLARAGFQGVVMDAVLAATRRSQELGQE
ncbi:MAG TPA: pyrroline-5-carboxylate reductase [Desulfobacterales bacterium]|nr:pyrroline-5-carboxylate reductase [Desulfobacterales bacterium]